MSRGRLNSNILAPATLSGFRRNAFQVFHLLRHDRFFPDVGFDAIEIMLRQFPSAFAQFAHGTFAPNVVSDVVVGEQGSDESSDPSPAISPTSK
jgi:hypothetical protein